MALIISDWPCVSLLILFPLLGALGGFLPFFSKSSDPNGTLIRFWSASTSVLTLVFLFLLSKLLHSDGSEILGSIGGTSIEEIHPWIPSLGITWKLVLDGLSYPFCLLTSIISLAVVLWRVPETNAPNGFSIKRWCITILLAESFVMGAFLCVDLLSFYVFFELMLLPVLVGIAWWGGAKRFHVVMKFALYTLAGSVFLLAAIAYCGWKANVQGVPTFDVTALSQLALFAPQEQILLGLAFMLAFAVKTPLVPFHSWLPDTYREAPAPLAAFTAALLGKVGIYGMLRFVWPLFPELFIQYGDLIAALGAVSVAYGALVALAQRDLRLVLAYSSISHLGFCVLGVAAGTTGGISGAVFQCFSHGIVTAALFLLFGRVVTLRQTGESSDFGGLASKLPKLAAFLMIFSFASVALPLTSSFVGEFLILLSAYSIYPAYTLIALSGVVLGAVYTLTVYLKVLFGISRRSDDDLARGDLVGGNTVVVSLLAILVVYLGIYPAMLLSIIEPVASRPMGVTMNDSSRAQLSRLPSALPFGSSAYEVSR